MTSPGPDIAWVDTIDACHLKCATCFRGVRAMQNSGRQMSLDTFAAVAARLREQGFQRIGFFNWTEPFLNRHMEDYVATAKKAHFWVALSSTLSLRHIDNLEETLAAGVDLLTVSLSGIDQETYQINHVGGHLKYVMHNMALVRDIIARRALSTRVDLRLLKFDYNAHQEPQLRDYAQSMGFNFELLDAMGDPKSNSLREYTNEHFVHEAEAATGKPSPEDEGKACELMFNQLVIDCLSDVYLCCAMPNYPSFRIGNFLEMTADEILAAKFLHPFCRACEIPRRDRTPSEEVRLQDALRAAKTMVKAPLSISTSAPELTFITDLTR